MYGVRGNKRNTAVNNTEEEIALTSMLARKRRVKTNLQPEQTETTAIIVHKQIRSTEQTKQKLLNASHVMRRTKQRCWETQYLRAHGDVPAAGRPPTAKINYAEETTKLINERCRRNSSLSNGQDDGQHESKDRFTYEAKSSNQNAKMQKIDDPRHLMRCETKKQIYGERRFGIMVWVVWMLWR